MDMEQIVANREFFASGKTRDYAFRQEALGKLREAILKNRNQVEEALRQDLHKSSFEGYMTEVGMTLSELRFVRKHLHSWMKKKRAVTPWEQFHASTLPCRNRMAWCLLCHPGTIRSCCVWNR